MGVVVLASASLLTVVDNDAGSLNDGQAEDDLELVGLTCRIGGVRPAGV